MKKSSHGERENLTHDRTWGILFIIRPHILWFRQTDNKVNDMQKPRFPLQLKFLVVIILVMIPVLGAIFIWTGVQNEKNAMEQVINQARVLSRQIILTREWVTDCGGIMVLESSPGTQDTLCLFEVS